MSTAAQCCWPSSTPPPSGAASSARPRTSAYPAGCSSPPGAFSIAGLLPDEAFLAWGWRACFLISIVLLAIGAYIRLQVMETPAFARVQERKEVAAVPLRDLLAAQPKRLLLGMGTRFVEGFTFNLYSVYLLAYVVTNLELPEVVGAERDHGRRLPRRAAGARSPVRCPTASAASRSTASAPGPRCCSRSRWRR